MGTDCVSLPNVRGDGWLKGEITPFISPLDRVKLPAAIARMGVAEMDDDQNQSDGLTAEEQAEEERKDADLRERLRPFIEAGWIHSASGWWVDPNDSDRKLIIDPLANEITYSAKLTAAMLADVPQPMPGINQ